MDAGEEGVSEAKVRRTEHRMEEKAEPRRKPEDA